MRLVSISWLLVVLPVLAADADLSTAPKKSADPITVRLKAKQTTYLLDRQGMTAEQYREAIKGGKIKPPTIDLVLEITNNTQRDFDITVVGAAPRLTLVLEGKGDVVKRTVTRARKPTVRILLEPGETHTLPITSLAGYSITTDDQLFWAQPGEYTLTASFETNIREPRSKAGQTGAFISKQKAYPAPPITLSVKLK